MVTQYHTLKEEDCGIDPDGLMRVRVIVRTKRSRCRDKVRTCEAR